MAREFSSLLLALGIAACQISSEPQMPTNSPPRGGGLSIHWEVVNRFRVIDGEDEERRFFEDVPTYIQHVIDSRWPFWLDPHSLVQSNKNYHTHWNARSGIYDDEWLRDDTRRVRLSVSGASENDSCLWDVGARELSIRGCKDVLAQIDLRDQPEQVIVQIMSGNEAQTLSSVIEIDDIWIVGLGDSYASGEGNPHIRPDANPGSLPSGRKVEAIPAVWWDSRCHRSLLSGQALAAAQVALLNRSASVTFLSFACSGAEITGRGLPRRGGILKSWTGRASYDQVIDLYQLFRFIRAEIPEDQFPGEPGDLTPQLDQMKVALANSASSAKRPDYVIISVGGNDIGFGEIAQDLLLPHQVRSNKKECPTLKTAWECYQAQGIADKIEKSLSEMYDALYIRIYDEPQIRPEQVILTEYPNIVMAENRQYCTDSAWVNFANGVWPFQRASMVPGGIFAFGGVGLDPVEARFADRQVIKALNDVGQDSIERAKERCPDTRWTRASGIYQASSDEGGGYCALEPWFLTVKESFYRQGFHMSDSERERHLSTTGMLHPNVLGHCRYADDILSAMGMKQEGISVCEPSAWIDHDLS